MTDQIDLSPDDLAEAFEYLDDLRESGETNMMGGGAYLERDLGQSRQTARTVLLAWMKTFSADKSPADRASEALAVA